MTHIESVKKYNLKAYDRIEITVPKGSRKLIQTHAENKGKTVNGLVNELLKQEIPELNHIDGEAGEGIIK